MGQGDGFLKAKGSYRNLFCYQKAEAIYDLTYRFQRRFLERGDRTIDQMVQAARSGKQNIVEGRAAATTSHETEIKLYNVARASLQELLIDYEDYLRTRNLQLWQNGHPRLEGIRRTCAEHNDSAYFCQLEPKCNAEELANLAITLIHQTDVMLRKLIDYAKEDFLKDGGVREQMTRARLARRNGN